MARGAEGPAVLAAARRVAASGWDVRSSASALPEGSPGTLVAPGGPLWTRLEDDLGDLLLAWLAEHPRASAGSLRTGVLDVLASMGAPVVPNDPFDEDATPSGSLRDIDVARPAGHAHLLVVVARFHKGCGEDAAAYILETAPGSPRLLAQIGAATLHDAPESAAEPLNALKLVVSPPDASGAFFVAVASVAPPCHSHWQTLRAAILRPGSDPREPHMLHLESIPVFYQAESGIDLSIAGDTAILGCEVAQSLDAGLLTRHERRRLRVDGDAVTPILPASVDPRGFVDEWLLAPWALASAMTAPSSRASLAGVHERGLAGYTELAAALSAPSDASSRTWTVEVLVWPEGADLADPTGASHRSIHFVMSETAGTWVMVEVILDPAGSA